MSSTSQIARVHAGSVIGVSGHLLAVDATITAGSAGFNLIGVPDETVSHVRDRVRAAVINAGQSWPGRRITVSVYPASLPKTDIVDVAIAVTVLAADGQLPALSPTTVFLGQLGLGGGIRPVNGVLPAVLAAAAAGCTHVVVPVVNAAEAALVDGLTVIAAETLEGLCRKLRGEPDQTTTIWPKTRAGRPHAARVNIAADKTAMTVETASSAGRDLAQVAAPPLARQAAEVAAGGGHHLLLTGPQCASSDHVALAIPGLLPDLTVDQALEVTAIASLTGGLDPHAPLITRPPWRAPYHTATRAQLLGGTGGPGLVTCAHRGTLVLENAPEFPSGALDGLKQPLETGQVSLSARRRTITWPARFLLALTATACPCGQPAILCTCSPTQRSRYLGRLSGPLLSRIPLRVSLGPTSPAVLRRLLSSAETTAAVADRVKAGRERARLRLAATPWHVNAEIPHAELRRLYPPTTEAQLMLESTVTAGTLSLHDAHQLLAVAWTLADLAGVARPGEAEMTTALDLHRPPGPRRRPRTRPRTS